MQDPAPDVSSAEGGVLIRGSRYAQSSSLWAQSLERILSCWHGVDGTSCVPDVPSSPNARHGMSGQHMTDTMGRLQ